MKFEYIYIIIIIIIVIIYNCDKKENFVNSPLTTDTLKQYIYNVYQADINAINNLSNIANNIINGDFIITNINIKGQLKLSNNTINTNYLLFIKNNASEDIHLWNINNPTNSNDLSIISNKEILRLNTSIVNIPVKLAVGSTIANTTTPNNILNVGGTLGVSGDSTLKQITANIINVGNSVTTTNTFNLDGNMSVSSTCEITDTLTVSGTSTLTGDSTISSNLKINTSSTDSSTLNINGTLKVSGNTILNTLTVDDTIFKSVIGSSNFDDLYNKMQLLKTQSLLNGIWLSTNTTTAYKYWLVINNTSASYWSVETKDSTIKISNIYQISLTLNFTEKKISNGGTVWYNDFNYNTTDKTLRFKNLVDITFIFNRKTFNDFLLAYK